MLWADRSPTRGVGTVWEVWTGTAWVETDLSAGSFFNSRRATDEELAADGVPEADWDSSES